MSKIEEFRSSLHEINVDAFMFHTKDEYLNEYSKELAELCGFTGTNGLLIVTKSNKCPFFTDGRNITQTRSQLDQGSFRKYNIQEELNIDYLTGLLSTMFYYEGHKKT